MKVWLDDFRPAPDKTWEIAVTAHQAIALLVAGGVTEISLDHDLGDSDVVGTGYDVALFIEDRAQAGDLKRLIWRLHTANPVGRTKMRAALECADIFWTNYEGR